MFFFFFSCCLKTDDLVIQVVREQNQKQTDKCLLRGRMTLIVLKPKVFFTNL